MRCLPLGEAEVFVIEIHFIGVGIIVGIISEGQRAISIMNISLGQQGKVTRIPVGHATVGLLAIVCHRTYEGGTALEHLR